MQAFAVPTLAVSVPCDPTLLFVQLSFQGMSLLQCGGCPVAFVGFDFALSDTLTIRVM